MIYVVFSLSLITLFVVIGLGIYLFMTLRANFIREQSVAMANTEAIASFMEYVAAFQGEDMMFDKGLRERASSHLTSLAEDLRRELV